MGTPGKIWSTENVSFVAALPLILLFGYTAFSKLMEYDKFIFQMRLAPVPFMRWAAPILAWLVPLMELGIVAMLVGGLFKERWRLAGFFSSFCLLLSFQIYISMMMLSGSKLPCTCGGLVSSLSWGYHLLLNWGFMLIAAVPILWPYRRSLLRTNICRVAKRE